MHWEVESIRERPRSRRTSSPVTSGSRRDTLRYLLQHLVEASAEKFPEHVAVEDGGRAITYAELHERSNRIGRLLKELGVRRGARVGLCLDKSLESVVAIYGILKAGAAYVPLDPQAPAARLGYIAGNCGITILLTGAEQAPTWSEMAAAGAPLEHVVVLNDGPVEDGSLPPGVSLVGPDAVEAEAHDALASSGIDLDLAYLLYTSGSTGKPKGVMLSHLNALTFVRWAAELTAVGPEDRLSNHAPLHFDLSIFDLFAAAWAGATVVLVPPQSSIFPVRLAEFIDTKAITVWYSVPSVLSMLTQRGGLARGAFPNLRTILFAGEVFPTKFLRRLMILLPHVGFYNLYGPTETNVCTYYEVGPMGDGETEPIPIGTAIDDVEVFAVTDQGQLAGPGEVGELYVLGTTVMQGYWGDPERTSRVLIPHPFGETGNSVYRTGDLVRLDSEGNYRLLGRRDHQIKSRGYRIELGEIEAALYTHPSVVECAVVAIPDELVTNRIRAFVVSRDEVAKTDLVRFCGDRIPHYMIPEEFEMRESLPKTSTGKVDRQALAFTDSLDSARRS